MDGDVITFFTGPLRPFTVAAGVLVGLLLLEAISVVIGKSASAAAEGVKTAAEVAQAERQKRIAVIEAQREAERQATAVTVSAKAEMDAASDHAEALITRARADADAVRIRAEAKAADYEVEAEGQRKINEARGALPAAIIEYEVTKERLRILPDALAAALKPLEKIGDVRIIDFGHGLPLTNGHTNGGGEPATEGGAMAGLVNQLLRYRAQAPVIDRLLTEAGFDPGENPVDRLVGATTKPTVVKN